ncbi:hypothetical protein MNBD_GAMMA11-2802 [hydrothermal vent metagenome]|uniref:Uncharacterized protein n=1 Tax=hydrothermal vent metagenome TaxID=652676 RepID=A0A3B0XBU7_9ZZZZ
MSLEQTLNFHEKDMLISLSDQAEAAAAKLATPLIIEIQIYFSCLLGKRLAFYSDQPVEGVQQVKETLFSELLTSAKQLTGNIHIRFNTVMTKTCSVSDYSGPPPVSDFKITHQKPYVPNWLSIDFKNSLWMGEYGWNNSDKTYFNTKQIRS